MSHRVAAQGAAATTPGIGGEEVIYIAGGAASGGPGHLSQYALDGTLLGRVTSTAIDGTGGAVDPVTGNPFWTNFTTGQVQTCPSTPVNGVLGPVTTYINNTGDSHPESLVFRGDKTYVGHADGTGKLGRFTKDSGQPELLWNPIRGGRGVDWIGLASDDRTLFYTSESPHVFRFDIETGMQLPNFLETSGFAYNFAVLPRFGDDHVFITGGVGVRRFDPLGVLVQEYRLLPAPYAFSAALSVDGTTLFIADYSSSNVWVVDVETGEGVSSPAFVQPGGGSYKAGGTFSIGGTQRMDVIIRLREPHFTRGRA